MVEMDNSLDHTSEFEKALARIEKSKRRERWIRYAAVLLGLFILLAYGVFGMITGWWGIGIGLVPFALMLILIGVIGIVISTVSGTG